MADGPLSRTQLEKLRDRLRTAIKGGGGPRRARELLALLAEHLSLLESAEAEHTELLAAASKARALARTMDGNEWSRKLDTFAADIESTVAKEVAALKKTSDARLATIRALLDATKEAGE